MENLLKRLGIDTEIQPDIHTIIEILKKRDDQRPKLSVVKEILREKRFRLPNMPDAFAELMAHVAASFHTDEVLNLCTGSGKVLYYLQNHFEDITGIDRSSNATAIARFLVPDAQIIQGDALWHPFERQFKLITNVLPRGGWGVYQDTRMPREITLMLRALDLLSDQGYAVFMVPKYLLYDARFEAFRQTYQAHFRYIVSLPEVYLRYGSKQVALLVMSKQPEQGIYFSTIKGWHRDLCQAYDDANKIYISSPDRGFEPEKYTHEGSRSSKPADSVNVTRLSTLADIVQGVNISPDKLRTRGDLLYLRNLDLQHGLAQPAPSWRFIDTSMLSIEDTNAVLAPGDIILSTFFNDIILFEYTRNHPPAIASANQLIIRTNAPDYVRSFLLQTFKKGIPDNLIENRDISACRLGDCYIPIVPLPEMDLLGDEHISRLSRDEISDLLRQVQDIIRDIDYPEPPAPEEEKPEPLALHSPKIRFQLDLPPIVEEDSDDEFINRSVSLEVIHDSDTSQSSKEPILDFEECLFSAKKVEPKYKEEENEPWGSKPTPFPDLDERQSLALKAFLENRLDVLEEFLKKIDRKVDQVSAQISNLHTDFLSIRNLPREIDEKFFALHHALDSRLDTMIRQADKIKYYQGLTQNWLSLWHQLEADSQRFLPTAEYIFDLLSQTEEADYAPFVIQYCRSLENEMLNKLFISYHRNWVRQDTRHELIRSSLLYTPTQRFAEKIRDDRAVYTLGEMTYIMRQIQQDAQIWRTNTLLSDFREFTLSHFRDDIVKHTFLDKLGTLTSDIRNRAAHADRIDLPMAKECQTLLRTCLNVFLFSVV
jgi:hypothetical protein